MPALLGPTNPVPGYEPQTVRTPVPQPTDTTIQNIVDPDRVVRPDQRTDRQDTGDTGTARYESNFMTFLQRLRTSRQLPETFMRLLQWGGTQVSSGIRDGFAREMAEFMEFIRMDEAELLAFLKNQLQSGSRFTGALFQMLREAYNGTQSEMLRQEILQFLRRFSDFSSTEHLEGKLLRGTEGMTESLPSQWSSQVSDILARLQNGVAAGDREGNLNLLRGNLFPLVARYVSTTHDHGRARALLSMMALDVARYENGNPKGLLQSFRHLSSMGVLPEELGKLSDDDLLRLLREADFAKAAENNAFAGRLAELTNRALQGEGGVNAQEAFQNILAALLINESVYMHLTHVMLPLDWNGELMFSELWVDPDAENAPGRGTGERGRVRVLIKLDIESLGAFDLLINAKGESVSLMIACPKSVASFSDQISTAMGTILTRNGLHPETISVAEMKRPLTVSEVFPKLFEKMSGINVKV